MVVKMNALMLTLGALLLGVGVVLGLVPMTQDGSPCGSAFSPNEYTKYDSQCIDALSSRRGIALALVIPGTLLALSGAILTYGTWDSTSHLSRIP